jgi:hypothetical protein
VTSAESAQGALLEDPLASMAPTTLNLRATSSQHMFENRNF